MLNEIIKIIITTFIPFLELRAAMPYGLYLLGRERWILVFITAVTANIILGIAVFYFIELIVFVLTKNRHIKRLYDFYLLRTQKKIKKLVEKYGEYAVAIFIAVPLPGSGVYSGALAAYVIGLDMKKFIVANIIGVFIAGLIVLTASYFGLGYFVKPVIA